MSVNNKHIVAIMTSQVFNDYQKLLQQKVSEADSPKEKINILFDGAKDLFWACRNCDSFKKSLKYYLTALDLLAQSIPYSEKVPLTLFLETRVKVLSMLNKKAVAHLSEISGNH
jgi:hypothetical protein